MFHWAELKSPKTLIKDVFSKSYCCYGNLLCHENDNVFTNDWSFFDIMIVTSSDKEWL